MKTKKKKIRLNSKTVSNNSIRAKLVSQTGETIGETLIALLISALALTMLAGAISTAAKLITKSEAVMTKYYAGITSLGDPSTSSLTVTINNPEDTSFCLDEAYNWVTVKYNINTAFSAKPIIAYKKAP